MAAVMVPVAPLEPVDKLVLGTEAVAATSPISDLFLGAVLDTTPSTSSSSSSLAADATTTLEPNATQATLDAEPVAGPSRRRYHFIAVRRGYSPGVYTSWSEAEKHVADHPCPMFKTFSSRLAAEAYVVGWDGYGRHALPASTPRPLREHLAMTFPSSVPLPPLSINRPSYHSRILDTYPPPPSGSEWPYAESTDFAPVPRQPRSTGSLNTFRTSLLYSSSPLRMQVEDEEEGRRVKKVSSLIGFGGLLSPPSSPKLESKPEKRPGATRARSGLWVDPPTPPASPQAGPSVTRHKSTLWDATPPTPQPAVPATPGTSAPAFSRSALKKSGVVMPVAAPKLRAASSLSNLTLRKSTASTPSLTSSNLNKRSSTLASTPHGQDRLSALVETSKRELERGVYSDHLGPPRPSFMRQSSNSSVSSLSSLGSLSPPSSITEEDDEELAEVQSPLEIQEPIIVQPAAYVDARNPNMSCTKSDGDVDSSVDSRSTKSGGSGGKARGGGGLFKRFSRVFKDKRGTV